MNQISDMQTMVEVSNKSNYSMPRAGGKPLITSTKEFWAGYGVGSIDDIRKTLLDL